MPLMSIRKHLLRWRKELILGATLFLVSALSFGFGYLANRELRSIPIIIEKCSEAI